MKYKYSNSEYGLLVDKGGKKTYAVCDCCGVGHQNNMGFEIDYNMRNRCGFARVKLCQRCANRIMPPILDVIDKIYLETAND